MAEGGQTVARRSGIHAGAAIAWGGLFLVLLLGWWLSPDEAMVRAAFDRLGPLAPAAYVGLEILQVVIAPVPGQPFEIAGGWLTGLVAGTVLGSIGTIAGSLVAFRLARRYGRPWVERRLSPKARRRVTKHVDAGRRAEWAVFLLMLVPAFPRDPLSYLAGLTGLSTSRFALILVIGRPVGLAPWVALGAEGVRVGVEIQLALAVAAGLVWLAYIVVERLRRRPAGDRPGRGGAPAGGGNRRAADRSPARSDGPPAVSMLDETDGIAPTRLVQVRGLEHA